MIILIAGGTHTGKTALAQRLLEAYGYPYLSLDHLKMGLIRSGMTNLTPESSIASLTDYLWPITREIIKTVIENGQNLIIEGCYIPPAYQEDFSAEYLQEIRYICLIMTPDYIKTHFADILAHASDMETRPFYAKDALQKTMLQENERNFALCKQYDLPYLLIEDGYEVMYTL